MARRKQMLKGAAKKCLPTPLFERIQATRSRVHQLQFLTANGVLDQVKRYVEINGTVVQSGPFAGLVYPLDAAIDRCSIPKLLGTYERELHPFLNTVATRKYDCVIDIGSAEGYYAAGLARMLQIPVYAYDPSPKEKAYSALIAGYNGVSKLVTMAALFTVGEMQKFSSRRALVICDCEGFEETLFRPDTLELTRNWDLIIELHGTADAILPTLNWPHNLKVIPIERRSGPQNEYRAADQRFLLCEHPDLQEIRPR